MSKNRKEEDRSHENDRVKEQTEPYRESESEFLGMEEDRYEIVEGIRYELKPAPTVTHQQISGSLHIMLYHTCHANGTILYSPIDVYLDADNQFQPDLVYILHENAAIIKEKRIEGAPDLVVEILSPSTSNNDKVRKKRQFERYGVKEYWIVDPVHRTIDQFILNKGKFDLFETYIIFDRMTSPLFSCIDIDMSRVFPDIKQ
ncbi:Uma2 family endonuclease [Cohnella silvisoli]|uniref:Uma2 family endonuclease n=1 Tax=Cohnella silvisoli TaxID=2873699 RepID=A0ABV1KS86_9BACL|nr:Uma2 family endonuclease [Cohnella silvisoli]MCD9022653.1 Uma2 family endonuclease [Cohnella silvisoli]